MPLPQSLSFLGTDQEKNEGTGNEIGSLDERWRHFESIKSDSNAHVRETQNLGLPVWSFPEPNYFVEHAQ